MDCRLTEFLFQIRQFRHATLEWIVIGNQIEKQRQSLRFFAYQMESVLHAMPLPHLMHVIRYSLQFALLAVQSGCLQCKNWIR